MSKYGIIDMETGELVRETSSKKTATMEINSDIAKEDLLNGDEELINYLYRAMKVSNKINQFGMIQVDGGYVSDEFFKIGAEAGVLSTNVFKLRLALSIRGAIKKTATTDCRTWSEVMEAIGINPLRKKKVADMRALLLETDLVRECKTPSNQTVFIVNPTILRAGSHTSDFCISAFKDVTLTRVSRYATYLMYFNLLLDYEDLN